MYLKLRLSWTSKAFWKECLSVFYIVSKCKTRSTLPMTLVYLWFIVNLGVESSCKLQGSVFLILIIHLSSSHGFNSDIRNIVLLFAMREKMNSFEKKSNYLLFAFSFFCVSCGLEVIPTLAALQLKVKNYF